MELMAPASVSMLYEGAKKVDQIFGRNMAKR
jgi:hypothetical protein